MATGPKILTDPIELLTPDLSRPEPFINPFYAPGVCAVLGFAGVCFGNFAIRRPVFSAFQYHAAATAAGIFIGKYVDVYRSDYLAERDAVLRHYIQLHPEDFPVPERKKFAEVLEPWIPIR